MLPANQPNDDENKPTKQTADDNSSNICLLWPVTKSASVCMYLCKLKQHKQEKNDELLKEIHIIK